MKLKRIIGILLILIVAISVFSARYVLYHVYYRLQYGDVIAKYAAEYNEDEYFIMSVINAESRFNKDAVSPAGATGLMQLTESTAKWIAKAMGDKDFTVNKLRDPETNIKMGIWYMKNLREEFNSDELVLAAYNAGRGNVNGWLNDTSISSDGHKLDSIPFKETELYVKKVLADEKMYRLLYR